MCLKKKTTIIGNLPLTHTPEYPDGGAETGRRTRRSGQIIFIYGCYDEKEKRIYIIRRRDFSDKFEGKITTEKMNENSLCPSTYLQKRIDGTTGI